MVGVSPNFYGLAIDGVQKEAVLVHTLYSHKKMALLMPTALGIDVLKICQ